MACPRLRQVRRHIGLPWGFMLKLHGHPDPDTYTRVRWHVLIALGAHIYMTLVDAMLLDIKSQTKDQ